MNITPTLIIQLFEIGDHKSKPPFFVDIGLIYLNNRYG